AGDKVIELFGEGNDTVKSSVSYALSGPMYLSGTFVETLQLTGTSAINGTGNGLNNVLTGNSANNILDGGAGNDTLTGGAGSDTFLFSFPASASNADTITDFAAGIDHIALASGAFHALPVGALSLAMFHLGTAAATANDHLIYDSSSGHLWYDADGTGSAAQNLIATLTPGTHLAATDVFVI
ncbi:M10 family metallopeptidase C-terminal domain-containing protein, partial [Novosphingobium sediminis]|uniref:M10 family metallopeptidase C-terminal domain-containing protein n=1 Tax=Novosphingobium sediminis TaxID=707214 RepID=UPI001C3FED4E